MKGVKMLLPLFLTSVLLGVFGQLSMKIGMNSVGKIGLTDIFSFKFFSIITQKYVFLGIVLYVIATFLWLVIISQEELSYVYPLLGIGYVFVAVLAKIFFNESLTLFRFVGILLILTGAYLIVAKI
jgi:multidrug transporter EmrE-like cation transporter